MYRLTSLLASGSVSTWIYSIPFLGATSDTCQDCGPIQWPDGTRFSFALACTFTVSSLQAFAPQGVEYLPCTFGITDHTCIPIGMDFINNMNVHNPRVKTVNAYKYQRQTGLFRLTSSLTENCGPAVCRLFDTSQANLSRNNHSLRPLSLRTATTNFRPKTKVQARSRP